MKITFLCSGSKGNCCLLENDNKTIVIDCGSTKKYLTTSFESLNKRIEDIDTLLLTHTHIDHCSQLKLFKNATIYSAIPLNDFDSKRILPLEEFEIDGFKVTPLPLSHDAESTMGFVIEDDKEKLVYITDTGYVNTQYIGLLYDADYIVMESNHNIPMLMASSRPQVVKKRIYSDNGHLCNEDCAQTIEAIITPKCKEIFLAHISQDTNTKEIALNVTIDMLKENIDKINHSLIVNALGQFEIVQGGDISEKTFNCSTNYTFGLE